MPYEFTPEERIGNILHVLDILQDRLHDSDSTFKHLWESAIKTHLMLLNEAVEDLKRETK